MIAPGGDAFPPHPITPTMRTILSASVLCLGLTAGFWYSLTTSLTDMTKADCQAGVQRACQQLAKDGVK